MTTTQFCIANRGRADRVGCTRNREGATPADPLRRLDHRDGNRRGGGKESGQADRPISTGPLNTLLCLHARPINVLVLDGTHGKSSLEEGFALRCFQRLSVPNIATLRCH